MKKLIHTFTKHDVGKNYLRKSCPNCNHWETISLKSIMGHVQKLDVGKKLYKINGIYQLESQKDEQKTA